MTFYEFLPVPIKATSRSFLVGYDHTENTKIANAGFSFTSFGDIEEIKVKLKGNEGVNLIEYLPHLEWSLAVPSRALLCIVNPEVRAILTTFQMPANKWYTVRVVSNELFSQDETVHTYAMLQILMDQSKDIDFSKSLYGTVNWSDNLLVSVEKGSITAENYQDRQNQEFDSYRSLLPISLCFYNNYDVLWGSRGLVVNENVKQAIEAAGFGSHNGLGFKEFTDYQIIVSSQ